MLGKNFRLVGRLGFMITPPFPDADDAGDFLQGLTGFADGIGDNEEGRALLSPYKFVMAPIIPTIRLGFSVSY